MSHQPRTGFRNCFIHFVSDWHEQSTAGKGVFLQWLGTREVNKTGSEIFLGYVRLLSFYRFYFCWLLIFTFWEMKNLFFTLGDKKLDWWNGSWTISYYYSVVTKIVTRRRFVVNKQGAPLFSNNKDVKKHRMLRNIYNSKEKLLYLVVVIHL